MGSESALQKAIAIITKATEEDRSNNYEEALRLYIQGVDYLTTAMKDEVPGEKARESIQDKRLQYLDRAEKLKEFLNTKVINQNFSLITKAKEIVTKATEEDRNNNYEEALRLYMQGVEYFTKAITDEAKGEAARESIRVKSLEYVDRAEKIKEFLKTKVLNHSSPLLVKAIEIVTKAVDEDHKSNYEEALRLYMQGVEYFTKAITDEAKSEKIRESMRAKCMLYLDRAEMIKKFLETKVTNQPVCLITKGIEIVTKATEEDRNKNYKKAVQLYDQAIENFTHVIKYSEIGEEAKESIRVKCEQYIERAEKIREAIKKYNLEAIKCIIKAIDEDRSLNYETALEWYEEGVDSLLSAIKYHLGDNKVKENMEAKRLHYLARAEAIKAIIANDTSANVSDLQKKIHQLNLEDDICVGKVSQTTWSDVVGLDAAIDAIKESVISPMKYSELFSDKNNPLRGILLYGPEGTGKSTLGSALIMEVNNLKKYNRYVIKLDQLQCVSESEKIIKVLFEAAREHKPSTVFIDEVDLLCFSGLNEESEAVRRKKNEFLVQMQGVEHNSDEILIVGATNKPWMLDSAILQHFEKRIYIPLPDEDARLAMFKLFLGKTPSKLSEHDLKNLAKMTLGYSGEDISTVVDDVLMQSIYKVQMATHFKLHSGPCPKDPLKIRNDLLTPCHPDAQGAIEMSLWNIDFDELLRPPVTMGDMLKSLVVSEPTVNQEELAKFKKFEEDCGH